MKRCSASLAFREMLIETIAKYHDTVFSVAKLEIVTPPNAGKDKGKLGHSDIATGSVECYSHFHKQFVSFFKNETCNYHMTQQLYPGHLSERNENLTFVQKPV